MKLQTRFNMINEMSTPEAKIEYKKLKRHIESTKLNIIKSIDNYSEDGQYSKMFSGFDKLENMSSIQDAYKLLLDELERVNV